MSETTKTIKRTRTIQAAMILSMMYMGFERTEYQEFQEAIKPSHRDFADVVFAVIGYKTPYSAFEIVITDNRYDPSPILWIQANKVLDGHNGDYKAAYQELTS
ncbi:hypothetical protein [Ferrimonas lipolytica]|uniref:Uncharacterized protein n=1 Tax=Ferrimonas lipolytica TaxID=2724191 RepID=A0A6H1UJU4_9GAMM|nr:hypothetical protein [Ferrimonas lipolytica]QIZ78072.1 hypothetical protein HER31_14900 [Ferrimonas lipolytica]